MIRVVLDTNIVVSAMLKPDTLPEAILNLAIDGKIQLCVSEPILAEYEQVLRRPRLGIDSKKVSLAMEQIRKAGRLVAASKAVTAAYDPDDNKFLECAQAAHADYLVTGNQRHFPGHWKKTQVIGPRELIEALIQKAG